jgi:O-antigen/teichoic acid export membrane protein
MRSPSLLRAATPLMVARGLSALVTFAIPVVLAHQLLQSEFGTYKQFFLLAATVCLVGQAGLTASLYYFIPKSRPEVRTRWLLQALAGLFVLGGFAAAGTLLVGDALASRFRNPQLGAVAPALALYIWAQLGSAPLEVSLTSIKRTGWAGIVTIASDVVRTASLVLPILFGLGVPGLAWAAAGFAALRLAAAWALALSGAIGKVARPTRAAVKQQLVYAIPFAGAVLLATAQMQLAQYFVAAMTDVATFAVYAVGVLQMPLTDMLYTPIAEVMMVRLAQADHAAAPGIFRDAVHRLCMFFLPLCAFSLAIGPELIPTLYSAKYLLSVPIFLIAATELPLAALPVDGLLRSLNHTGTLLRFGVLRLLIGGALVPIGFFSFGLVGAMLGYVLTQWTVKLLLLWVGARRMGAPVASLIPFGEVGRWALRGVVVFSVVTALRLHGPWHGWTFLFVASALAALVWGITFLLANGSWRWREAHG